MGSTQSFFQLKTLLLLIAFLSFVILLQSDMKISSAIRSRVMAYYEYLVNSKQEQV